MTDSAANDEAPIAEFRTTADGVRQFYRRWPVEEPKAAMQLVHGVAEHSGRYLHVGRFFAEHGYDVTIHDNRGFGRTEGRRAYVESFDQFLDDIEAGLGQRATLGVPVVLYGHSLGGLMAARYLTVDRPQPDLAVLSSPALDAEVPTWQTVAAPILGRLVPRLFITSDGGGEGLSHDPAVGRGIVEDPLTVSGGTAGFGHEVFTAMKQTRAGLSQIRVPTYVLHGDADPVVPQAASRPLAELDGVTYRSWPGLLHECHNEPEWPEVLGEVDAWLQDGLNQG